MAEFLENTPKKDQKTLEKANNPDYVLTKSGKYIHVNQLNALNPFPKGVTGNPAGKPAGTKSTKVKQWEVLHESIAGTHTERFNKVLATLDDKEFMDNYLRILEYFKPRLQRAENINANVELDKVVLNLDGGNLVELPSNFDDEPEQEGRVGEFVNEELSDEDVIDAES